MSTDATKRGRASRRKGQVAERQVAALIADLPGELWRPVSLGDGFWADRYDVSNLGRVRTVANGVWRGKRPWQMLLNQRPNDDGYLRCELQKQGRRKFEKVHRLVAHEFIGPMPEGMTVNHVDGDKSNNTAANLEYLTRAENIRHSWAIGARDQTAQRISESRRRGIEQRKAVEA